MYTPNKYMVKCYYTCCYEAPEWKATIEANWEKKKLNRILKIF